MATPRTYVGEMEWALGQINILAQEDRNPNRQAQLQGAVNYGLEVALARRSKLPIPPRPDIRKMM